MIKYIEKYTTSLYLILFLSCFFLFIFQRIDGLSLKIGSAYPVLLVPAVIAIGCFLREWTGFWFGLFCGIALDTVENGTFVLNTLVLMLIGFLSGLLFHFILNRNIKAITIVGFTFSGIYFFVKWLFLSAFTGDVSAAAILFKYELPSAIYTALFTIPFFYFLRWISNKHLIKNT